MLRPLFLASSLLALQAAWAEEPATPRAAATAAAETASQQMARGVLMDMARFLSGREAFRVDIRVGYDVIQENGQKIEFGEIRQLAVQRPDRVRIEETTSDGGRDLVLFDGKNLTILDTDAGVYAQGPQPGDIDASVVHFVRDLKMRLPLAPLLMSHLPEELEHRARSVDYVESTDILGERAHHIVGRTSSVDFQLWISAGKRPLPLRVVLSYRNEPGQPQFWAQFSRWDVSPRFAKGSFEFKPPAGARHIAFAADIAPQPAEAQTQGDAK
jgi:hypothetical protein